MDAVGTNARDPKPAVAEPKRVTWNGAIIAELRALQEPGDPDLVAELLQTFRDDASLLLEKLRDRAARRDLVEVHQVAHRLKGGALNLGADKFADAASALERASGHGDASAIDSLVAAVVAEHARFFERTSGS